MGAYNILKTTCQCNNCAASFIVNIQFKFADTWQNEYVIGEEVKWGGADIGTRGLDKVKVYGVSELDKCPVCGCSLASEYDIYIEKDIIKSVSPIADLNDYNINDGNYVIC